MKAVKETIMTIMAITLIMFTMGLFVEAGADGKVTYDYIQAEMQNITLQERDGVEADGDSIKISGSRHIHRRVNVFALYRLGDLSASNNATHKVSQVQLGVMYHHYLRGCLSVNVAGSYNIYKVRSASVRPGPNRYSRVYRTQKTEAGADLTVGAGCRVSNVEIKVDATKQLTDRADVDSANKYGMTGAVYITDNLSAILSYEKAGYRDWLGFGLRLSL